MEFTNTLSYGAFTAAGILMAIALSVFLWRLICHIDIIGLIMITGLMMAFPLYLRCRLDPADAEKLMTLLRMPSVLELKYGMFISVLLLLPVAVFHCWKKAKVLLVFYASQPGRRYLRTSPYGEGIRIDWRRLNAIF